MPCYRDQQQLDKDIVPKLLPSIAGHCCFQDKETSLIQRGPTRLASASPSGRGVTEGDGEGYTAKHHSGVVMSDSTVEMAVHLLANAESAPYFSARMAVVPPIGIPASTTATPVASSPT